MKPTQRTHYFGTLWPAVVSASGWKGLTKAALDDKRRAVTVQCMQEIAAPVTDSTTTLDEAQITALFTYMRHMGNPDSLVAADEWVDCKRDYIAFHKSKQADWWQAKAYGNQPGRLARERFHGRSSASGEVFSKPLTRKAAEDRLMTMRARAQARGHRRVQHGMSQGTPFKKNSKPAAPVTADHDENPF